MITSPQRRARLWHRHHLGCSGADVHQTVHDLVAFHSSDPLTPHLGLWARVPAYRVDALDQALDSGQLWRMHAMRRTLWVVSSAEAPAFDGAAARQVAAKERTRLQGWLASRPDASTWLAELERLALQAIADDPGVLTRTLTKQVPDLATKVTLGSGKWTQDAAIGSRLLFVLAMEGKLARCAPAGSWKSSQYGWRRVEQGFGPPLPEDEARAVLLRRYLARFGPATFKDVTWWTGWTVAHAKKALAAIGAVSTQLDDGEGWLLPDDLGDVPLAAGVALLPGLDPTPMGHKERDWFLGPHQAALFDRNGNVGPTIWQDGRIVGGWAVDAGGVVRTRLLEPADETAVDARAQALTAWLEGASATPRFRTPLERELTAA